MEKPSVLKTIIIVLGIISLSMLGLYGLYPRPLVLAISAIGILTTLVFLFIAWQTNSRR